MTDNWIYIEKGFKHILNSNAVEHILFLIALVIPYLFKDWKKIIVLLLLFVGGHSFAFLLSYFGVITIKLILVKFVILICIIAIAFFNLLNIGKSSKQNSINTLGILSLFSGVLQGLLIADFVKPIQGESKVQLISLFEYSIGIHCSQFLVIFAVLLISNSAQSVFRLSKRDWIIGISSFVIGIIVPLIIQSGIWIK